MIRHVRHQGPTLRVLGKIGLSMLRPSTGGVVPETPSPRRKTVLPPRPPALIGDYARWSGADPKRYRDIVPPHLFCQWGFPLLAPDMEGLPYPLARVLNQGVTLTVHQHLAQGVPLACEAWLDAIEVSETKVRIRQRIDVRNPGEPLALEATLHAVVPLDKPKSEGAARPKRARPRVPDGARELARLDFGARDGLAFAALTGDFNPVHWIPPYARAAGFRSTILHGFGTFARTWETLVNDRFSGNRDAIRSLDVRFTRPLVLPATARVFLDGETIAVGEAPGGPANLLGTLTTGDHHG